MGEIFHATDSVLGRAVAVKVLGERYADEGAVRTRFTREALAAARLSGEPSIVTIFDVGEWAGRPFIVMEYLSGGSLAEHLARSGAQQPGQVIAWLEQAARALDAAHRHGIVHRDVKPANLLLDGGDELHVVDFGIASAAGMDSLTKTGTVLGTAGYLSPEQAMGARATPASDRYGLAVVAFELLAGSRPFARESSTAEAMAHVNAPVPPISAHGPALPPELDSVFHRALAKAPADRYSSCAEFAGDLRAALEEAAGATSRLAPALPPVAPVARVALPPSVGAPRRHAPRRWPILLTGLLAAGIGGVALASALANGGDEDAVPTASSRTRQASPPRVVTERVTAPGTTRQVTVTAPAPTTAPTTAPIVPATTVTTAAPSAPTTTETETPAPSAAEGVRLTDQSTGLIRQGRYAEALPLAQRALAGLGGSGQGYEAYANYNVGKSLLGTGRCAEALPYLDRSEALQGPRSEHQGSSGRTAVRVETSVAPASTLLTGQTPERRWAYCCL